MFITSDMSGLSNIHVATSFTLMEEHPEVQIHYATFPKLQKVLERTSASAKAANPAAKPIKFHKIGGRPFMEAFMDRVENNLTELPGVWGMQKKLTDLSRAMFPYSNVEQWDIHDQLIKMVDEIDPAVIIIDSVFRGALEVVENKKDRRFITMSPNALLDLVADKQGLLNYFWKYPSPSSGYPYPIPRHLIPANIYIHLRYLLEVMKTATIQKFKAYLAGEVFSDIIIFGYPAGYPVLSATLPEANFPMDVIPEEVIFCGPVIRESAAAADQDGALYKWIKDSKRKTVVVNLGTLYVHDFIKTQVLAETMAQILAVTDEFQFLWKVQKGSGFDENNDLEELAAVKEHMMKGTVRVQTWFDIDTVTILQMESVVLFVNHAGGNSYHEGVYAGIPQVSLPLWYDCYNLASLAQYVGVGIWADEDAAPDWHPEALKRDFLRALVGDESVALRKRAAELGEKARAYGGRHKAAAFVASVAAQGE
jgi:hypothetical protein